MLKEPFVASTQVVLQAFVDAALSGAQHIPLNSPVSANAFPYPAIRDLERPRDLAQT